MDRTDNDLEDYVTVGILRRSIHLSIIVAVGVTGGWRKDLGFEDSIRLHNLMLQATGQPVPLCRRPLSMVTSSG